MSETPLLGLPLIEAAQAQKHVTHNEALLKLDGALHLSVITRVLAAPPAMPAEGDRYLIAAVGTGTWAAHGGELAFFEAAFWRFAAPRKGWRVWIEDEELFLIYTGTAWRDITAIDTLQNMALLGVNTTADTGNRLAVSSPGVLLSHAGSDHRLKINKLAAANTGSLLYQTNFSGRAEMGLAGDDDFHLKVSPDGAAWLEAIQINRTTGAVNMPNTSASGLADGDKGDVVVAGTGSIWRVERGGGAVGDGVTDDTAALQSVLTGGRSVVLGHGKSYLISARLNITTAGTGIIGDGSATLIMGSGAGQFDNGDSSAGARYGTNACGVYATGIARPMVKGVRIKYQTQTDDRYVKALAFSTCTDIVCDGNEAWNFTKAGGVFTFNDCSRGSASFNHIHSCTTNSASNGQITGIETDNDCAVGSFGLTIEGNRIHDLTVGASFLAAFGYQTDGINFAGGNATPTHHCTVTGNWVYNAGEGIDCFGSDNIISNNIFDKCYNYGVKLIHSASRNVVSDNGITSAGLGGIVLAGSSSATNDAADNLIQGNRIYKIDPDGAWAANSTFGIAFTANGGTTYLPRRNRVLDNYIDGNSTGKYGVLASASAGTLNEVRGNRVVNFTERELLLDATVVPYVSAFINDGNTITAYATDAAIALLSSHGPNIRHTGTLSADRAVTLPTENVHEGMAYRITRTGPGAFNLNVGTGPLKALVQNTWCEVLYTGGAWVLGEYGSLTAAALLAQLLGVDGAGSGLDADFLDGQSSAAFSLSGHTHVAANVTDFAEAVDDRVAALLVAGTNITLTYNDGANSLTIDAAGGGGGGDVITINGTAAADADFDDATPAAAAGGVNVFWQKDAGTPNNVSAYVKKSAVTLPTEITDALAASANDYSPSGYSTTETYHQWIYAAVTASVKLTGLAGGVAGKKVTIVNSSTDFLLWLENQNAASTAANRFKLPNSFPAFLMPGDMITLIWDSAASRWRVYAWPSQGQALGLVEFSDFSGTVPSASGQAFGAWSYYTAGTGASSQSGTYLVNSTEKPMGIVQLDTGTTATGRVFIGQAGTDNIVPAQGPMLSVCRLAIEAAVTGTETYTVRSGFSDEYNGTMTDAMCWEYRWNGSAAEWSQTVVAAAAATRSVSGSPGVSTNYIWLVVFVNAATSRVDFIYSDDSIAFTKASSVSSGLPTANTSFCAASIIKSAGTTQRNITVDLAGLRVDYARG